MSSITFDATLDSSKLESSIKQSKKTVQDWAGEVEKSGGKAERSFGKLDTSLKDSIKHQKEYIKGLTKEVGEMQRAFDKATAGIKKSKMGEELGQAKRRLGEATGELIGMQNEQIAVNNKQKESTDTLTGSIGKWVLSLGGAALALRAVKEAVLATTVGLNAFNIAGAAAKQVMYNLVTAGNLTEGLQGVVEAQRELNRLRFQDKLDTYKAKKEMLEYNEALIEAKDQTNSVIDRIKAYDDAITHKKKSTEIEIQSVKDQIAAYKKILDASPGNEKAMMALIDLGTKLVDLRVRETSAMKEISSMRSGLIKKDADDEAKRLKEQEDKIKAAADKQIAVYNSISEQQKLLNEAVISGTDAEIKVIAERIVLLQEELVLREKLTKQAIGAAIVRGEPIGKANIPGIPTLTSAIPISSILAPGPNALKEVSKYIEGTTMLTKKALAEVAKAKEKYADDDKRADEEKIENTKKLIGNAILFTDQLVSQLDLTQEQTEAIGLLSGTIVQLVEGNFLGAALGILAKVIGVFGQMGDVVSEPTWKKQIAAWDALIERQKRVIELSERTGGTEAALKMAVALAQKELDDINAAIAQAWERRGTPSQEILDAQRQAINDLFDAQQALNDFLTGGITQIDIAGTIAQGFKDGLSSATDFADKFDDLMRNAINSSLMELSKPAVTAWYKKFAADMASEGGLDSEEIVNLKKEWDAIIAAEEKRREAIYAIAGISDNAIANVGLTGQIRRDITEETGTELLGLFRRFADEQRVVKDYSIMGVSHLVGIEANTMNTVLELQKAVVELQSINTNTKQVAVAGL
uniref:Putative tail tape measure protein n=1 Tax=viral metagenome TaxID=1070528 RepID=A0A6M3XQF7_9ZZZZ